MTESALRLMRSIHIRDSLCMVLAFDPWLMMFMFSRRGLMGVHRLQKRLLLGFDFMFDPFTPSVRMNVQR